MKIWVCVLLTVLKQEHQHDISGTFNDRQALCCATVLHQHEFANRDALVWEQIVLTPCCPETCQAIV